MDAAARRSFCGVRTLIVLTVLLCISFLVAFSGGSRDLNHSTILHRRYAHRLLVRQTPAQPGSTTIEVPGSSTTVSSSQPGSSSVPASPSSALSSSSAPLTTPTIGSTSIPAFPSVSVSASSVSIASQSRSQSSSRPTESSTVSSSSVSSKVSSTVSSSRSVETITFTSEILNIAAATTFALTNNFRLTSLTQAPTITPTVPSSSSAITTSTSTPISAASKSSGFWQNKGAVAATFMILALVSACALIVAVIAVLKRRSMRKQQELHEELFEKFSEPDHRSSSPSPSINVAPMDPFASRDMVYGVGMPPSDYGTPSQRSFHSSTPVQHPDFWDEPAGPTQYTSPSQLLATSKAAPPPAFRNPVGRDSYQQSIDSFYGAAGQPSTGYS